MMKVLKTLAISFGGGLALGAGMRLAQGPAKSRSEPRLNLDPLFTRLKSVENRIVEMESLERETPRASAAMPPGVPEKTLAAFESRLAAQLTDVQQLRGEIRHVDQRLGELDVQLPILIQSTVDVRFREVEQKLQQDFEEAQSRSMTAFAETLQSKVVERISTLETNLAEQSHVIGKLRDASVRSDENLQKMLAGIERLVDQTKSPQSPPPAPTSSPPPHAAPAEVAYARRAEVTETLHASPLRIVPQEHEPYFVPGSRWTEPKPQTAEPALVLISDVAPSEVGLSEETTVPVLARVPEISRVSGIETPNTNGASSSEPVVQPPVEPPSDSIGGEPPASKHSPKTEESYEWVNRIGLELLAPRPKPRRAWRIPLAVGLVAGLMLIVTLLYSGVLQRYLNSSTRQPQTSTLASTAPAAETVTQPAQTAQNSDTLQTLEERASSKPADPASLVALAREYQRRKDWTKAESAYRSALETSPANRDAALGLSDVLYQQQKYEESAAVLNKLSSDKSR
jgi:uncharacterized coiled-coil protein SlyX